ncbi:hypothetical protein Bca101_047745 [Brassica carinata]
MVNMNAFDNHNMVLPNHPLPVGNYSRVEEFVPGFNHNMVLPSHHNTNESGNEHPHDGHSCKLENLKKQVIYEAFKIFLATPFPHPGFYGGSSSNAPFGVDGGINMEPNLNPFEQRRMVNVNAFDNHNMVLPDHPSPFGNYSRVEGFVPGFNHNMALPSHPNPNESGNEHPNDGNPPQPRSD